MAVSQLLVRPHEQVLPVADGTPLEEVLFSQGVEFPCGGALLCGRCRVRVISGQLDITPEMRSVLTDDELTRGWRIACQCRMQGPLTLEVAQWEASVLTDETALPFEPAAGLGIAIDLGTTTLVAQVVDLGTGEVLGVSSGLNPQAAHGADVMSRIQFALSGEDGAARLMRIVREALGSMIRRALATCERSPAEIRNVLIAGNTVMHHLFCGLPVEPLSHVPFVTEHAGAVMLSPQEIGWDLPPHCAVDFLPCLGGFVGSDLLAGIVACHLENPARPAALIDLGTNGEIILSSGGRLLCASTAAGPAFEGGGIRMGMRAGTGAIVHVRAENGRLACQTLGGHATGICGSGLVDAVAAALSLGSVLPDGRMPNGARELQLEGTVHLTRSDIRELQLAKAAIASGLRLLAERAAVPLEELQSLHLAGAFGNYIDVRSAHRIGLLELEPSRICPEGNAALRGVRLLLLSPSRRQAWIEDVLARSEHVPLVSEPGFEDCFVDCLAFPALEPAHVIAT